MTIATFLRPVTRRCTPKLPRTAFLRTAAAAAVLLSLAAVPVAAAGDARGSTAVPSPAGAGAPLVRIQPDIEHLTPGDTSAAVADPGPPTTAQCEALYHQACYQPAQLQKAYDLQPLFAKGVDGRGQTIVIVDSFGSPTIASDLAVFDQTFGIPAPPSLTVIQPAGPVPPYVADGPREGWAGETTLDVEYSHAMAPGAAILLVETPTSENEGTTGFPQIEKAEQYVVDNHLGGVISQSFSATEETFGKVKALLDLRGAYIAAAQDGVTVLAASGDSGAADVRRNGVTYYDQPVTSWPDSDPLVTGVGGTQLHLTAGGNKKSADTVWNDTYDVPGTPDPSSGGGGRSVIFSRPSYQDGVAGVVGSQRGVPDISMSAACNGAVDVYQGFAGQVGWYPTCGTSEATPLFAGIVALADQVAGHPLGLINPALYALSVTRAPGIVDVTKGDNTVSFMQHGVIQTVTGFPALPGYDLASGVGTVDAAKFVPELAQTAG